MVEIFSSILTQELPNLKRLQQITKDTNDAIFMLDKKGKVIFLNQAGAKLLKINKLHLKGQVLGELVTNSLANELDKARDHVLKTEKMQIEKIAAGNHTLSLLILPLHSKENDLLGVWGILRDATKEVSALEKAERLDSEIEGKKQAEETRDRLYRLQYVTSALAKATTEEEIAEIIISLGTISLKTQTGTIWLYNEKHQLELRASHGVPKALLKKIPGIREKDTTPTLDAIKRKKIVILRSLEERKKLYPHTFSLYQGAQMQAFIAIPLISREKVLGAVNFSFDNMKTFSPEEQEFMTAFVDQSVQALERVKLYEEERQQKHILLQTLDRLTTLQDITAAMSKAMTYEEIAQIIVEKGVKPVGAKAGEITLVIDNISRVIAYAGYPKKFEKEFLRDWKDVSIDDAPLLSMEVMKSRKPLFITNTNAIGTKYLLSKRFLEVTHFESEVILPLFVKQKEFGVFFLFFDKKKTISAEEKQYMQTLAEVCSQAFERAFAYEEEKRIASQLQKNEAWFRSLIENSSDAIVLLDKKGTILYSSPSTFLITGHTPDERLQTMIYEYIYPGDRQRFRNFLATLSSSRPGEVKSVRYRIINKDKTVSWVDATANNLLSNPSVQAIVINYRNIQDKVEAEESLKESKEELQIILQGVTDGVIVRRKDGSLLYANPAAIELNRFIPIDNFMSKQYGEYLPNKNIQTFDENGKKVTVKDAPSYQVVHGKSLSTNTFRISVKETNEELWRKIKCAPIYDSKGEVLFAVSIVQDVTEEMQQQKMKDEFISTASHELKTPITSAKLYTELLQKHAQEVSDEKGYQLLGKVDTQLNRLTRLIKDLLDATRIRSGKFEFHKESICLETLVEETVEEMQYSTITHSLIIVGHTKKRVWVDRERIRQVLVNLISNAIKYSPQANKVTVIIADTQSGVLISIKDNGVGIDAKNKRHIFEPFFRVVQEDGQRFPGLGLGLHIASEIVKSHNGYIEVTSKLNKGSVFSVYLPEESHNEENRNH